MSKRVILEADKECLWWALKAADWLLAQPPSQKDAILGYGQIYIYVRRNKSSISARQIPEERKIAA